MKNKLFGVLIVFVFCFIGVGNVKAEKFEVQFNCGDGYSTNCTISISDGVFNGGLSGCYVPHPSGNRPIEYSGSDMKIGSGSGCYKLSYKCTLKDNKYQISNIKFDKTDKTSNDAANGIICTADSVIDAKDCRQYTADNWEERCPNHSEKATYQQFKSKCDNSTMDDFEEFCNGEGKYSDDYKGASLDEIRNKASETKDEEQKDPVYEKNDCNSLMNSEVSTFLKDLFFVISIVGVVILIFMIASDFIKAIASSDNDAMNKAFSSTKTRIIAVIILLILPALVSFIINLINDNVTVITDELGNKTEVRVGDPSECNITK